MIEIAELLDFSYSSTHFHHQNRFFITKLPLPNGPCSYVLFIAGFIGIVLLLIGISLFFIDEPLRGYIESELNNQLAGYSVELEGVDFHPLGFSINFENLILRQNANPDPPLLTIPLWTASIQWAELLKLKIVSDHHIVNAKVVLRHSQAEQEVKDETALENRGWQQALFVLYPVKINSLRIEDSFISYRGQADYPPLELTKIQLTADNIRNIRSPEGDYPSTVQMEGTLHTSGRLNISGKANFLAELFPGVSVDFDVNNVELKPFIPISSLLNLEIHSGTLNGAGHLEYSPWKHLAHITTVELENPLVNYREKGKSKSRNQVVAKPEHSGDRDELPENDEPFQLVVEHATMKNGELGYVNQTTQPSYRIFFNNLELKVAGLGVPKITQTFQLTLNGQFMGEGDTSLEGVVQPEIQSPDFYVKFKIGETEMKLLNEVLKAHGYFDVKKGKFSFYSELKVQDGLVKGYTKPFFKDPEVFDLAQDKKDNVFQQLYEGIVDGLSSILENVPRNQVATKTKISGNLKRKVDLNKWELIGNLLKNAFIDALTPSFERIKQAGKD